VKTTVVEALSSFSRHTWLRSILPPLRGPISGSRISMRILPSGPATALPADHMKTASLLTRQYSTSRETQRQQTHC